MRNKIKNQSGCLSEILEVKNSSITYKRNTKKISYRVWDCKEGNLEIQLKGHNAVDM
jgi:hypothetical protein